MKIRSISKREERQLLSDLLATLDDTPDNRWAARFRRELISFSVVILLVTVAFGVLYTHSFLVLFTTIGGIAVGLVTGIGVWRVVSAQRWTIISRCLDRATIEARLRELNG